MTWDNLNGEYIRGYTQAILDIKDRILGEDMYTDCRYHHKTFSFKTVQAILDVALRDRAILRENIGAFIRVNPKVPGGFETIIDKNWQKYFEKNKGEV